MSRPEKRLAGVAELEAKCTWSQYDEDEDYWETACGHAFSISDGGTPTDNDFSFCVFCGSPLKSRLAGVAELEE